MEFERPLLIIMLGLFLVITLIIVALILASPVPLYCQEMMELNPDWQFHYDNTTGCRVLFRDFWIPVDDMPNVLRGGE